MRSRRIGAGVAMLALLSQAPLSGQGSMFVLRHGSDTVSVERFTRTASRLEGELLIKQMGMRLRYDLTIGPDGLIPRMEHRFWQASDAPGAAPRQSATFVFRNDSVIVDLGTGAAKTTQRFATKPGVLPHINPSFALMELYLARAKTLGGAGPELPLFATAGAQTFVATVTRVGADSAVIAIPGGEVRLAVDANGSIRGGSIPAQSLTLERSEGSSAAAMAVEKPDYSAAPGAPYTAEEVKVPTPMGHTLAGTLTLPRGASRQRPVPAIVTITGSGPEDRDEAIPLVKGYRPFRQFADSLGRRGIAVLRMDDRGFGASGGDAAKATSADFAEDIRAGLAYLRTRPEIDPNRLGLLGHSEGGIIGPLVALKEPALRAMVLLAGPSRTGRQILQFQLSNNILHDSTRTGSKRDSALAGVAGMIDSLGKMQPWMGFFLDYDPLATARKLRTPVLILNGGTDQQVTPDQVPELAAAFKGGGNPDVTSHVFPEMNHLFIHDPSGYPGGYTTLTRHAVEPEVVGMAVDWLVKHLSGER